MRARNVARALAVSEAEFVAAGCGDLRATRLTGKPQAIFRELSGLGRVMALTRNEGCVHERYGRYKHIQAEGPVGLVLGPDIDLRVFFSVWHSAWAVCQAGRHSLQFFDEAGNAVHKVYCTEGTELAAYHALVARYAAEPSWPELKPYAAPSAAVPMKDVAAFRAAWLAMQDTNEFVPLLQKFEVMRLAALQVAGDDLAQQVDAGAVQRVLQAVAERGLPIMCFVGNRGMIQIHTGPVQALRRTGPWFNVLDPDFNLHLNTEAIASVWVVNKPTLDGWVTSLEVYGVDGDLLLQLFGERKPGRAELPGWRRLLAQLCPRPLAG
jgi:putative hemin transport protein